MQEPRRSFLLAVCPCLASVSTAHAVELQGWSHWAIEDNTKTVLEGKINPKGWCALFAPKPK